MISYRVTAHDEPLERHEAPTPVPEGTEVLVRIDACGVCHSDLHYWHGGYELGDGKRYTLRERGIEPPFTMGHEPVGVVESVGPRAEAAADTAGVVPPRPGDRRLIFPWLGCGDCSRCAAGRDIDCDRMRTLGLFTPGGYATHAVVPHPRYLVDVDGIGDAQACTLACAGLTAYSALGKIPPLLREDQVVLLGAGGVGLTAVGFARTRFGRGPIVVDPDPTKTRAAARSGAQATVTGRSKDVAEVVTEQAHGHVGAVVDFVGTPDTAELALSILRRGGTYVVVGLFGGAWKYPLALLPLRNQRVVGSLTGTVAELRETVAWVREHGLPPVPTEVRPLAEATRTLEDLEAGRIVGRAVLRPE